MIARFVHIVFGVMLTLVTLTMLATPRTVVTGAWEPQDCGLFNCEATVDTSEVVDRHRCTDLRIWENSMSTMVCDGKVIESPAASQSNSRGRDLPYGVCPAALNDPNYILCPDNRAYEIQADGRYV